MVCFLIGMVVGIPALRLKGIYLALVTLVFTEAVRAFFKYDELEGITFDYVVTVCGHADEQCPVLPLSVQKIHWPLSDPAKATGTEDEIMAEFRATRDEVRSRVAELLDTLRREATG